MVISFNCSAIYILYIVDTSRLYIEIAEEKHEARLIYHKRQYIPIFYRWDSPLVRDGGPCLVGGRGGWSIFPLMGSYLIEFRTGGGGGLSIFRIPAHLQVSVAVDTTCTWVFSSVHYHRWAKCHAVLAKYAFCGRRRGYAPVYSEC